MSEQFDMKSTTTRTTGPQGDNDELAAEDDLFADPNYDDDLEPDSDIDPLWDDAGDDDEEETDDRLLNDPDTFSPMSVGHWRD